MKREIIWILLLLLSHSVFSQTLKDTSEFYLLAIEKEINHFDDLIAQGYGFNRSEIIYIKENSYIRNYPPQIMGIDLIEITSRNAKQLFRKNGRSLLYFNLEPIKLVKDELVITITKIEGRLKWNNWILSYGNWTDVYFKFNSNTKSWEFLKTEIRGI